MTVRSNTDLYRPRSVYASIAVTIFFVIGLVAESVNHGTILERVDAFLWGAFVLAGAYLLFYRPCVIYFDEGVTIINPFKSHTLGWDMVESIEAQYTMSLQVNGKIIRAWAAPAPGRYHSRSLHLSEIKGMKIGYDGLIRPGESPRSDSGQASYLAKLRLEAFKSLNIEPATTSETVNHPGITLLVALFVMALGVSF